MSNHSSSELVREFVDSATELVQALPTVAESTGFGSLDESTGWRALRERLEVWRRRGDDPVLVCVLYGPTGTGKSTFFKMLTGRDVPAGGATRPMSFVGCVAVPGHCASSESLSDLFPQMQLRRLESPDQLKDRECPSDVFYWLPYDHAESSDAMSLIISDVPDFNSVETRNWERAKRMLDRAEFVLFLAYDEAYKNRTTVDHLEECCRRAASLGFVLTKCDEVAASIKWNDLRDHLRGDERFAARRHDGQTLLEFFEGSSAFFSERAEAGGLPELEAVRSVHGDGADLSSLLRGLDQRDIVRRSLMQPVNEALGLTRRVLAKAEDTQQRLQHRLETCDRLATDAADRLATNIFPIGQFLEIFNEVVQSRRWWITRTISGWFAAVPRGLTRAANAFSKSKSVKPDQRRVEQGRLAGAARDIINKLREEFPDDALENGILNRQQTDPILKRLRTTPPPAAGEGWLATVRREAEAWCKDNPNTSTLAPMVIDVLLAGGATAMVVDLFIGGGFGTLTTATLAAGGATAGTGLLAKIINDLNMSRSFDASAAKWHEQRRGELRAHLKRHLLEPLCASEWRRQIESIEAGPIEICSAARQRLSNLIHGSEANRE